MGRGRGGAVWLAILMVAAGLVSSAVPAGAAPTPAPTMTGISPSSGPTTGGQVVAITGTGLSTTQSVTFGSNSAANQATWEYLNTALTNSKAIYGINQTYTSAASMVTNLSNSEPSLTFAAGSVSESPATAQIGVAVSTDGNGVELTSPSSSGVCLFIETNEIEYSTSSPPGLPGDPASAGTSYGSSPGTTCSPGSGAVSDWVQNSVAALGGQPAPNLRCTATLCLAVVPPGGVGSVNVVVFTPNGNVLDPDAYTYNYPAPPPSITGVAPPYGAPSGGGLISIAGTNLATTSQVSFGAAEDQFAQATLTPVLHAALDQYGNDVNFPPGQATVSALEIIDPSLNLTAGPATFGGPPPVVGIATSTDGNAIVLAAASQAGTCFYAAFNGESYSASHPPGLSSVPPGEGNWYGSSPGSSCHAGSDAVTNWSRQSWTSEGVPAPTFQCSGTQCLVVVPPGPAATVDVSVNTNGGTFDLPGAYTYGPSPVVPPGIPTGLIVRPVPRAVTLRWSEPTSDGGSPITDYVVTPYVGSVAQPSTTVAAAAGTSQGASITGLTDGTIYTFTVSATNAAGRGAASVRSAPVTPGVGYRLAASDGGVFALGAASFLGSAAGVTTHPIVGTASTPDQGGYWLVASDGGVFSYGDAGFHGSMGGSPLTSPVVGIAATSDGQGYWLVASDGGVFAFGDAGYFGSMGSHVLNAPMVAMVPTPDGQGYWLVAADGGIFGFGDAGFHGSTGSIHLQRPIVGAATSHDGQGYWLVASDGGIFAYGDATFEGSAGGSPIATPVVGMATTSDGGGYWLAEQGGPVLAFGDAPAETPLGTLAQPVVGITSY